MTETAISNIDTSNNAKQFDPYKISATYNPRKLYSNTQQAKQLTEEEKKQLQQQQIQQQQKQQEEKKAQQNKFSSDVASLEYMSIANKRNEKFSGNLINIINANQEKDGDIGLNKIRKALTGGAKILDLSEKIKFVDEKGETQEYSVDDLATDAKFTTLSGVAQQNFLKAFSDPDRGKSDMRLKFDKVKNWFLPVFGVVGIGSGILGTLLLISVFSGGFLAAAAMPLGIFLGVVGAIGVAIAIAFFINKIASYSKNSKIAKKNANVRKKIDDLSTSVYKDKEEVQSKLKELKKSVPKEDLTNIDIKGAVADGAKRLDAKQKNVESINQKEPENPIDLKPNTKDKQNQTQDHSKIKNNFADTESQTASYIQTEQQRQAILVDQNLAK